MGGLMDFDPATRLFFVPRTVSALLIGMVGLVWWSGAVQPNPVNEPRHKDGVIAMAAAYIAYSALQGPSSVMIRPHPTFWRIVHGCGMVYLLALVFILMQGKDEARHLLKHIDSALGQEPEERAYGTDCRLWVPGKGLNKEVIEETVFDIFVVAHTLGWWAKALIFRNYWMLWTCSIGFEFMELTFQHWLPNFNECWWDSWILDVAVCNLGGLLAGMATVRYFGSKKYNWQGISMKKGLFQKAGRGLLQFTPYSFEIWNWAAFKSPLRCLQALLLVALVMMFELNAFFLKTLLWIPPPHKLNILRLVILGLLALPGVKEYHTFINAGSNDLFNKLGSYAWLAAAILLCEVLIVMKLGRDEFTAPFPRHIVVAWSAIGTVTAATLLIWQLWLWRKGAEEGKTKVH